MKKSKCVSLTILAAAAIAGCDQSPQAEEAEVRRCVDKNNVVVAEKNCPQDWSGSAGQVSPNSNLLQNLLIYHWLFGGNGGYAVGSRVYGGNPAPTPGYKTVPASDLDKQHYAAGGGRVVVVPGRGYAEPSAFSGRFSSPSARGGFGESGGGHGGGGGE